MNRILLAVGALVLTAVAAVAAPYTTTGGYGSAVIDATGASFVNGETQRATYSYVAPDITPVATATDVLVIRGSATKTVRIKRIAVEGTATSAGVYDVYIKKHTVANTGGTATNPTPTKHDSSDGTAAATLLLYTANPTVDSSATVLRGGKLFLAATGAQDQPREWEFGANTEEALTLRGAAQELAINFNGAAVPAGSSLYLTVEWTEE